ncbi:MAG: SHOCT domain-containing protein, partial [Sphaerobacter thermophilus]|uniref:SHOCT domain-containing protein n=1 Tax=Sphaerobacter thermophilus TaxID=2057 RepID=UPI00396E08ED
AQIDELHSQLESLQAQQVQAAATPPAAPATDLMTQIQQLAQLKEAGMLTDDEFQAAKAKLLAS